MFRFTRRVFTDLGIWMLLLGTATGIIFPFFVQALGVPSAIAQTLPFVSACVIAGMLVGAFNFLLARSIVASRMRMMNERMQEVENRLQKVAALDGRMDCGGETCLLPVDSNDFIGDNARAFNVLMKTLQESLARQQEHRIFTEILSQHLELADLASGALGELLRLSGASAGLIAYESGGELALAANTGILEPDRVLKNALVEQAFGRGIPGILDFPDELKATGVLLSFVPRQVALLPISYKEIPTGILVLASVHPFDDHFLTRMKPFLQGFSLALHNSLAHERLQRMAALDPLTGVYNRRFGQTRLHEEFGRAVRSQSPLGLLMFDIDHFKSFNDTYGHLTGDRVLKHVAAACRRCLREGDLLVRFGGEEFYAALPAASCADLAAVGERVRRTVEELRIPEGDRHLSVTVSIGGAAFPCGGVENEEDLIRKADEALYRAKQGGRNRVDIAPATAGS